MISISADPDIVTVEGDGVLHALQSGKDVTKPYILFISRHEALFLEDAHRADGKTPDERMQDAGIVLGENSDYYGENIAMAGVAAPDRYMQIYQPEAKAVYGWLYQDKDEQYGHRNFVLHTGYHDDTGEERSEGLLAAYMATYQYRDDKGFYWIKSYTVMDGFDPAPSWDYHLTAQERVMLYRRARE